MNRFDDRECRLVALVALSGGRMSSDDPALEQFQNDRSGSLADTINLCFDKGALSEVRWDVDNCEVVLGHDFKHASTGAQAMSEPEFQIDRTTASGTCKAMGDVLTERLRQVSHEGWTAEHDDAHRSGALAHAGACYAIHSAAFISKREKFGPGRPPVNDGLWPWDDEWWKPTTPRRDLVKAAALLVAEIERLDRLEAAEAR